MKGLRPGSSKTEGGRGGWGQPGVGVCSGEGAGYGRERSAVLEFMTLLNWGKYLCKQVLYIQAGADMSSLARSLGQANQWGDCPGW